MTVIKRYNGSVSCTGENEHISRIPVSAITALVSACEQTRFFSAGLFVQCGVDCLRDRCHSKGIIRAASTDVNGSSAAE
ncbi:MAG: hypothetical protein JW878_02460 [Methanomicrobia archaeon]|nr:hypothetical protein [Methanomicrobia archaeon]